MKLSVVVQHHLTLLSCVVNTSRALVVARHPNCESMRQVGKLVYSGLGRLVGINAPTNRFCCQWNRRLFRAGASLGMCTLGTQWLRWVVLLSDAFGLPLVNTELTADKLANDLQCDVWVPDLFDESKGRKPSYCQTVLATRRFGTNSVSKHPLSSLALVPYYEVAHSLASFVPNKYFQCLRSSRQ